MTKKAVFFFLAFLILFLGTAKNTFAGGKKILMVIAPYDFRDEELFVPKGIFEQAGYKVDVASTVDGKIKGMLGGIASVDYRISEVYPSNYAAVVFVGGIGAQSYFHNRQVLDLAKTFYKEGKVVAASCIAPVILANAGLLHNKKATVWPSESIKIKKKRAIYYSTAVVRDGRIVTSNGPAASTEFANKILEVLGK